VQGCDCVVWPEQEESASDGSSYARSSRRSGVLSVALASSPAAARLGSGEVDTVVLELAAGSYAFTVSTRATTAE
jgi:hypothetical protein